MKNQIVYEWVVEELDDDDDIIDTYANESLDDVVFPSETRFSFALCRRLGDDDNGESDRTYAYVIDGKLPSHFEDGYRIPQRFHIELEKFER